jgi:hypothetical protein
VSGLQVTVLVFAIVTVVAAGWFFFGGRSLKNRSPGYWQGLRVVLVVLAVITAVLAITAILF